MYTFLILILGSLMIGYILQDMTWEEIFLQVGAVAALILTISWMVSMIPPLLSHPTEVATPGKYTNKTYYIDNSKRLYIQQNDTTKPFGGDISSKIEYKDSAKEPSIEFKTVKSAYDNDVWIPFKYNHNVKTSISKVILPKSALTDKLTKVNVLNQTQSDSTDLTLID